MFSPLKIKNMELKNRIVLPPMCMKMSNGGYVNDFHLVHYATRAVGQMGLLIVEATAVLPNGRITNKDLGIWDDKFVKGLKKLTDIVHKSGAKIGIQLAHAGRKAKDAKLLYAPSAIKFGDYKMPIEMTQKEIDETIKAFGLAAKRAYKAGFDFIEIHAAHGYLINQFLSPVTNKRDDKYGGSFVNRIKFLKEIICEVKKYWPEEYPIGVRLSATEYIEEGLKLADTLAVLYTINHGTIDVVNVTTGGITPHKVKDYPGYQLSYAKEITDKTNFKVIAGGLVTSPQMSQLIIDDNIADLIYIGRLALKDPYFPLRFAKELNKEIDWPEFYIRAK